MLPSMSYIEFYGKKKERKGVRSGVVSVALGHLGLQCLDSFL